MIDDTESSGGADAAADRCQHRDTDLRPLAAYYGLITTVWAAGDVSLLQLIMMHGSVRRRKKYVTN